MILHSTTVTREEWEALPDVHKTGIALDAIRPITERDLACHAHYLLDESVVQPESVEVATTAPREVVVRIGNPNTFHAAAAASILEDQWDREMLEVNMRLSFEPKALGVE